MVFDFMIKAATNIHKYILYMKIKFYSSGINTEECNYWVIWQIHV